MRWGAWVTVMDINIGTLRDIGKQFNEEVNTQISNRYNLKKILPEIDVVYNCVRWPKDAKEYMIDREMVRSMEKGSVIVDISNDYGMQSRHSMRPPMKIRATSKKVSYIIA